MTENTRFILTNEGRFFREYTQLQEVNPGPALDQALMGGASMRFRNLIHLEGYGLVHMVSEMSNGNQHWSVPLNSIDFKTTFNTFESEADGKLMCPKFLNSGEDPQLTISWLIHRAAQGQTEELRVRFVVIVRPDGNLFKTYKQYLYAFDSRGNAYRMPLANLFDTCEVCNGEYHSVSNTPLEVVQKALAQFKAAPWNADLFKDEGVVCEFVRLKPLEQGFQTMPIVGSWRNLCRKVSTTLVKFIEV